MRRIARLMPIVTWLPRYDPGLAEGLAAVVIDG
jgi:hypothetical protein